jgi:hypothetical protein
VDGGASAGKIVVEKDQLVLALGIEAIEQQARFTRPPLFRGARRKPFDLALVLRVFVSLLDLVCGPRLDLLLEPVAPDCLRGAADSTTP